MSIGEPIGVAEQVNALGRCDVVIHNAAFGYQEPNLSHGWLTPRASRQYVVALCPDLPPPDEPAGSRPRSQPTGRVRLVQYRSGNDLHVGIQEIQISEPFIAKALTGRADLVILGAEILLEHGDLTELEAVFFRIRPVF
jgi:hypothetical protein